VDAHQPHHLELEQVAQSWIIEQN